MRRLALLLAGALALAGTTFGSITAWDGDDAPASVALRDPWDEMGHCIASRLTSQHKQLIASSLVRSADPVLIGRLLPLVLGGEITHSKQEASRAIGERHELRDAVRAAVERIAGACGFHRLVAPDPPSSPIDAALAWLQYDDSFKALLAHAQQQPPDAAARLYIRHLQSSYAASGSAR